MQDNIFVSTSRFPPERWRLAFPTAEILPILPVDVPEGSLLWLHNLTPAQLPGGQRPANIRFIVLHDTPSDEAGLAALSQGAVGYANANATPELLRSIESVIRNNGLWVGESLLNRLLGSVSKRFGGLVASEENQLLALLNERERRIAICIANGESNKEVARLLELSERTIKLHLTHIFKKLNVRDRLQLALLLKEEDSKIVNHRSVSS